MEAVRHARAINRDINRIKSMDPNELFVAAKVFSYNNLIIAIAFLFLFRSHTIGVCRSRFSFVNDSKTCHDICLIPQELSLCMICFDCINGVGRLRFYCLIEASRGFQLTPIRPYKIRPLCLAVILTVFSLLVRIRWRVSVLR